jgi:DNA-binding Lrp family transcriptional regulator
MNKNNMFQGEMDPELAALLGASAPVPAGKVASPSDYAGLFGESSGNALAAGVGVLDGPDDTDEGQSSEQEEIGLGGSFPDVGKKLEDTPIPVFDDPNYYKIALSHEGDSAKRLHEILQKFLNAKDPKDRGVFRQQIIAVFWDFLLGVAKKAPGSLPDPKKFLLRYGVLHPALLNAEAREIFSLIVVSNGYSEPIYYLDEWLRAVGTGVIRTSTTDEVNVSRTSVSARMRQLLDKAVGKRDGARSLLRAKDEERMNLERGLKERISYITEHHGMEDMPDIHSLFSEAQKKVFVEIQEALKMMIKADRELDVFLREYNQAVEDVQVLTDKVAAEGGSAGVDSQALDTEFGTIRQMAKMTIGRQGNQFPILIKEYFHCMPQDVASRENILAQLKWVESIDPQAFCRSYKNKLNRIVPYVILIPTYGDTGICWEPFDRYNRATSRGRIAIPMYSKSLPLALLSAVGDLRWQNAKEKASFYWMEEGLTGNYYQWFAAKKFKGDLKEFFINDYILWMTRESEGTQKLDKEVRGIFWRYMPFPQEIKEKLKTRSFTYQELYQRDLNRAKSDL